MTLWSRDEDPRADRLIPHGSTPWAADMVSEETRSRMMSKMRSKRAWPELVVRRTLWGA